MAVGNTQIGAVDNTPQKSPFYLSQQFRKSGLYGAIGAGAAGWWAAACMTFGSGDPHLSAFWWITGWAAVGSAIGVIGSFGEPHRSIMTGPG